MSSLVVEAAGSCSFCAKGSADVGSLTTRPGRSCRICAECAAFALELFADARDASADESPASRTAAEREAFIAGLAEMGVDSRVVAAQRGTLDKHGYQSLIAEWVCSFCDAPVSRPYNLMPSVVAAGTHICTSCLAEASSLYPR